MLARLQKNRNATERKTDSTSIPTFVSLPSDLNFSVRNQKAKVRSIRWVLEVVLATVLYFVSGRIGVLTAIPPGLATAVWPPSGVALAALLLYGYRIWPGVFLGSFLVNFPTLFNATQGTAAAFVVAFLVAFGSTLQAMVGRFFILRFIKNGKPFSSGPNVFRFVLVEICTCPIAATLGAGSLLVLSFIQPPIFAKTWLTWWLGDLAGIMVVTPFLLELPNIRKHFQGTFWSIELLLLSLLTALTGLFIFGYIPQSGIHPLPYVSIIFILWAAFRLQQFGTTLTVLILSVIAIWGTTHGLGPFINPNLSSNESLLLLQTYVGVLSIMGLSLAATIGEGGAMTRELQRFKFIGDHANDPHFLINREGLFVYVNKMACDGLGYSENELLSMSLPDIAPQYPKEKMHEIFNKLGKEILPPFESVHRKKDGSLIPVEISARAYNLNREFYVFSTARDISERKRIEEELKRSMFELEQFASIASHDLQSPLRNISNFLGLLQRKYGNSLDEEAQEYIRISVDGAKRMHNLVGALLEHSKIGWQPLTPVLTDFAKLVEVILSDLKPLIDESRAEINFQSLPTLVVDRIQMELVFRNLIQNAVKFRRETPPKVEINAKDKGSEWEFTVRDNGIGIKKESQDKLFKMFQRLHTNGGFPGTGIGLATTKKIIDRQGGRIWVDSDVDLGSCFHFTIPKRSEGL